MAKSLAELLHSHEIRKTREKYLKKMIKLRKKNQLLSLYARCLFDVLIHYDKGEFGTCDKCVHSGICKNRDTTIPEECAYRMAAHNACLTFFCSDKEVRKAFNEFIRLQNLDITKIDAVGSESFKKYKEKFIAISFS